MISSNCCISTPSSISGIGTASIPKSSSNLKCLSNPGTGQINFGFFKLFHANGSANR